jgi:hypothetical protein
MPQEKDKPVDPDLMAETIADAPALRPKANKPKAPDPALDDTAIEDLEIAGERPGPKPVFAQDIDDIYDKPEAAYDTASLSRFDPERGKQNVAIKIRAVTEAVRNTVTTPFGKLLLAIIFGLAGVTLTIAAITLRDTPYIVAAIIVAPIGFLLVYWRYQAWLGHKRYMYRLLETLGEDVSDFDPRRVYRRAGKARSPRKPG